MWLCDDRGRERRAETTTTTNAKGAYIRRPSHRGRIADSRRQIHHPIRLLNDYDGGTPQGAAGPDFAAPAETTLPCNSKIQTCAMFDERSARAHGHLNSSAI
jgi:hypothetical protein